MDKIDQSKNEMIELLELINEQAQMLKSHQGEIPQLYIDMLKKNTLRLYEQIHTLDQIKHLEENISNPGITSSKTNIKQISKKDIATNYTGTDNSIQNRPKVEEKEIELDNKNISPPVEPIFKAETSTHEKPETRKPIIDFNLNKPNEEPKIKKPPMHRGSDLFAEATPSIADKLSAQQDPSLGEKMQQNQITDIRSAIGINDKFLFVNELFSGNLNDYNQAVDQLNKASNQVDATIIFEALHIKYNWESINEAVKKFRKIINRKNFIN